MWKETLKAVWYWCARVGCRVFCATYFRFRVYGAEYVPAKGAFILASNHQSFLDPVLCGVGIMRRLSYVARASLFSNWFFRSLIYSLNAIPIGRGKADVTAVKTIIARLNQGWGVCLYPEATRTSDGTIAPFKPGFGLVCRRAKAVVIPTLIDGAFECWPRHKKLFSPGAITVCYGRPIQPQEIKQMTNEQLADLLTTTLRQMQHDCRIKQGKKPFDY